MVCIGFDIGGTKCAVSVGKVTGEKIEILGRVEVPTGASAEETLERLAPTVEKFRDEYSVQKAGISCGGPLDEERGVICSPPNLPGWDDIKIVDYLENKEELDALADKTGYGIYNSLSCN